MAGAATLSSVSNRSSHITGRLQGFFQLCEQFIAIGLHCSVVWGVLMGRLQTVTPDRERERSSRRALLLQAEARAKCQAGDTNDIKRLIPLSLGRKDSSRTLDSASSGDLITFIYVHHTFM